MMNEQESRQNARIMILEGAVFWAGLSFLQGDTVITNFISIATGSVALAGLAATFKVLFYVIGQFVFGLFIHRVCSHSRLMVKLGFFCRPVVLLMALFMLTGLSGEQAAWMFLILYALFFFLDGMINLCWTEICTRTLPIAKRGEVVVLQQTFAGLVGLLTGWVLRVILGSSLSFQNQYTVIFGLSGVLLVINVFLLSRIRDVPHPSVPDQPPLHPVKYLVRLLPILKHNRAVRLTLAARACYLMTLISAPINLMFGRSAGLHDAQLATLVFMPVAGQIIAGVLWARVCRRTNYPTMMLMAEAFGIVCAIANLLCFFLARAGVPVMLPLSVTMILIAVNTPANNGFFQHMITQVDARLRADTVVLSSLVVAPLSFGTYLAGLMVETVGYMPVYLLMLVFGVIGFLLVRRRIPLEQADPG
ncbi:MAG: MFS transporter [Clostridiales bacterium]|nr:MFS transporter [Clostridiales bacterium]